MANASRPQWLAELIKVVQLLCRPEDGRATRESTRARKLGRVTHDTETGGGWFWLDLAGRPVDSDQLETAYLAPGEGPERRRYQLIEAVQDGNLLKIRVGAHAPSHGLFLWVPGRDKGLLQKSLLDGLSRINQFNLVNRLGTGQADPVPAATSIRPDGLNERQAEAWTACRTPGVQLVWGPPGTGKTKVIALALQDLVSHGKTALLVSSTNIAVDNALGRAAQLLDPAPGLLVRVGIPQDPEVASDSRICLQKMIRERQGALEQKRGWLEDQISTWRNDPDIVLLEHTRAELADFDISAYQQALTRLDNQVWLSDKTAELSQITEQIPTAGAAAERARQRLADARRAHQDATPAREHIRKSEQLITELQNLELERDRAAAEELSLEGERSRLTESLAQVATWRGRRERRHLSAVLGEMDQRLGAARNRRNKAAVLLSALSRQLIPQIEELRRAAHPHTALTLSQADTDLARSEDTQRESQNAYSELTQQTLAIQEQINYAQRQAQPTPADVALISWVREHELPEKRNGLAALEQRVASGLSEIKKLEERHEQVMSELSKQGRQAARQLVGTASVVAATLTRLRLNPELYEREYDHVIVDEVAAACAPEVVYAASLAKEGVTLLGDFLQNGPIVPGKFEHSDDPAVQRWYHNDCFAMFGICDPETAQSNPGCVVLNEQYRFGPVINELANEVAYGGVLQVAESDRSEGGQEVVLVDVDGLGDDLAQIRRDGSSKWWPVGAMLARALAARQLSATESANPPKVGIITPYRAQRELIQNVLSESGASPRIEAGTSHQFQGREFDTLIFDLVEDGTGWIARGYRRPGASVPAGLRVFNVGVTRAKRRLYLIVNEAAIQQARRGPLLALRRLQQAGRVHVVRAAEILDLTEEPDDSIAGEVWHALRDHVTLIDVYDEDRLPEEMCGRIDQAQKGIWLWSPWVGQRSTQLLPHLQDATDRGVDVHVVVLPLVTSTRNCGRDTRNSPRNSPTWSSFTRSIRRSS
jgi:hypothetical protein